MTPFNNNRTNNQFASGRAQFDGTGHTNGRTPFDGLGHTNGRTPFDGLGHTDGRTPFHGPGNTGGRTPFHGPGNAGGGTPFHGPGNTGGGTPFHGPGTTGGGTLFCGPGNTGGGTPFYGPGNTGSRSPFNGMGHAGGGTPLDGFGNGSGGTPFDGLGNADGRNLGGSLPALPFRDKNETQELFLAPSQGTPVSGLFRLFYEPGNKPGATQGSQSTVQSVSLQASQASGPPASHPIPPRAISQSLRNIYFDFLQGQNIWKTPVVNWTWDQFKEGAMKALGQPRDHLDTHLASLDQAGMLKWKCIVVMHRLYGSTKNPFVASNDKFQPFLKAVVNNPASKVIIHISMDDPNAQAAKKVQEGLENETLALSYAAPEERQALAMSKERLIVNPKSNVEAGKRTKMIAKLTAHIISVYGCNAKALAVRDPDDKNRLICITRDRLYIWAQALQHNALDADFDSPPRGSKLTLEPYTIATVVELLWGRIELERDDCLKG
ncbi:hypothetical protein PCASD_15699 [Puccinia coronata f. sp. avenae]|uniref:Uncharacterized protein n=1 Tax=Puccinia coronata f. sp. avenae TaxID=200324 RepID=A0A2N5UDI3_9BASI|nr:hypothetical protein PCASD_15699 [Puccinia coronata f. sp. avenae]